MILRYLEVIHLPRCSKTELSLFLYTLSFNLVARLVVMPPPLSPSANWNSLGTGTIRGHLNMPPYTTQRPGGSSGLFYWDEDTAASKIHACEMHACERYVPIRDISTREAWLSTDVYLTGVYFKSVHLRGVHLMGGRISQGVRIS